MRKLENFFVIILYVFPHENVDSGRTKLAEQGTGCYFKRDVSNPLASVLSYSATARPAGPARSSELAQLRSAFDSDRYQNRQMVEMSQISPVFGTFT